MGGDRASRQVLGSICRRTRHRPRDSCLGNPEAEGPGGPQSMGSPGSDVSTQRTPVCVTPVFTENILYRNYFWRNERGQARTRLTFLQFETSVLQMSFCFFDVLLAHFSFSRIHITHTYTCVSRHACELMCVKDILHNI